MYYSGFPREQRNKTEKREKERKEGRDGRRKGEGAEIERE